jgi:heme/copper-type cytochrome/quinol oxidase subunit 2
MRDKAAELWTSTNKPSIERIKGYFVYQCTCQYKNIIKMKQLWYLLLWCLLMVVDLVLEVVILVLMVAVDYEEEEEEEEEQQQQQQQE